MSEDILVRNCAPTMAGLKTGNLFVCPYGDRREILDALRQLNQRLGAKGVRALPLRYSEHKALIYLYRPARLERDLARAESAALLKSCGYSDTNVGHCLARLGRRLRESDVFPHEIGLFLGYPPADVRGFIEKRPCKCTGCWRVYADEASARKTFALYRKCTRVYCSQLAKGVNLERLTVAG